MRNFYGPALVCLATASLLGGCGKNTTVDFGNLKTSAEKTEGAERLLTAGGFMHADKQLDEALKLNPNNAKARLYKALLAPAMANRGIMKRIEPLAASAGQESAAQYAKAEGEIPAGDVRTFLFDGKPDIVTETDAQNHVRVIQNKLRDLRTALQGLKKEVITLHMRLPKPGVTQEQVMRECPVTKVGESMYLIKDCSLQEVKDVKVNFADLEAGRLYAAGTIVYLSEATAYDLTGLVNVVKELQPKAKNGKNKDRDVVAAIQQQKTLGNLVDPGVLKEVLSFGAEGVEAVRYAAANQGALCPAGIVSPANRPGYVVSEGVCLDKQTASFLSLVENMVKGPVIAPFGPPKTYETQIDVTKPLNGSVTDLKTLLPATFNNCGDATSMPDETLGGLFPNKDATATIRVDNPGFLNTPCRR